MSSQEPRGRLRRIWAAYRLRLGLTAAALTYLIGPTLLQWWSFRRRGGVDLGSALLSNRSPVRLWLVGFLMMAALVVLMSLASDLAELFTRHRQGRHRAGRGARAARGS